MTLPTNEFRVQMEKMDQGSRTAAENLHAQFKAEMREAARRRLPKKMRSKYDPSDIVQLAWLTFWKNLKKYTYDHPRAMGALLQKIVRRKVVDAVREQIHVQKRDIKREVSLTDTQEQKQLEVPDNKPTPTMAVIRREEWEQWQHFVASQQPFAKRILEFYQQGLSARSIAHEVFAPERKVRVILENLLTKFQDEHNT